MAGMDYGECKAMTKSLVKHGNSYALLIDKPVLVLIRATPETKFEIVTDGQALVLTPVRDKKQDKKFQESLPMVDKSFGRALKKLAEQFVRPTFLDLEQIVALHLSMIERYGGSEGLRDLGLLQSAIAMPQASFGGEYLHKDIFEMAAAYLFHIVQNHPFIDGNKRTGAAAALVFLVMNDVQIEADEDGLVDITLATATGQADKPQIAAFFRSHVQT